MIIINAAWKKRSAFYSKGNISQHVTLISSEKKKILRTMLIFYTELPAHRLQDHKQ